MFSRYLETKEERRVTSENQGQWAWYKVVNSVEIKHLITDTMLATRSFVKERNVIFVHKKDITDIAILRKSNLLDIKGFHVMTRKEWKTQQKFIKCVFLRSDINTFYFSMN